MKTCSWNNYQLFIVLLKTIVQVQSAVEECGSTLTGEGTLQSQGYPNGYPSHFDCTWTIQAGPEDKIDLAFIDFGVEEGVDCPYDFLQIFAMGYAPKFCGTGVSKISPSGALSVTGEMSLRLKSDESEQLKGFSLRYKVTPKPTEAPPTTPPPATTAAPEKLSCATEPCQNGAECADISEEEVYCFCEVGYEGNFCEINVDECESSPCENGGTCFDGNNEFSCTCLEGFLGPTCGVDIDECQGEPCQNGGTCTDGANSFECECVQGYTGWNCAQEVDECESGPCQNMGVCEDFVSYYFCTCYPGYTGINCEIEPPTTTPAPTTQHTTPPPPPPSTALPPVQNTVPPSVDTTTRLHPIVATPPSTNNQPETQPETPSTNNQPETQPETPTPIDANIATPVDHNVVPTSTPPPAINIHSPENVDHSTESPPRESQPSVPDPRDATDNRAVMSPYLIAGIVLGILAIAACTTVLIYAKCFKGKTKILPTMDLLKDTGVASTPNDTSKSLNVLNCPGEKKPRNNPLKGIMFWRK